MTKKKLLIIPLVLLLCLALLVAASFAWLSMSRSPEISGIDTQIGANGNLEIALLNDDTYLDPGYIKTGVGTSAAAISVQQSNMTWGNIVDLSDESYGLHNVSLLPSRLNLSSVEDGRGVVNGNMLMVPSYGSDGRTNSFYSDTISATYRGNDFTYFMDQHGYGVRGIGSILDLSPQQSALTNARSLVRSYQSAASNAVNSIWNANGIQLFDIVYRADAGDAVFTKADVAILRDTATRTYGALSYVESALRQTVIGAVASCESGHSTFKALRQDIENVQNSLSDIIANTISVNYSTSHYYWDWELLYQLAVMVEVDKDQVRNAFLECDYLTKNSESFVWDQISPIYNKLLNTEYVHLNGGYTINDYLILDDSLALFEGQENSFTLIDGAGPLFNISSFVGRYSVLLTYSNETVIDVSTLGYSTIFLEEFSYNLKYVSASGNLYGSSASLDEVYGYAVDLAFRTNAKSNLMLQIDPEVTVDKNEELSGSVQGNGSYMSFTSKYLNEEQVITMMDAVRVGFLDNRNILVGIAKLNTSNYTEEETGVFKAPLYMYEYRLSSDGSISIGERRNEDSVIMSLEKSTPTILTAIVWLDGDHTDNSIASSLGYSLTGKLNLQFTSDADLKPAGTEEGVTGENSDDVVEPDRSEDAPEPYHGEYKLSYTSNRGYSIYSVNDDGTVNGELMVDGYLDGGTFVINKIKNNPDGFVVIPSTVEYIRDEVWYAVEIEQTDEPFFAYASDIEYVTFYSVYDSKVSVRGGKLSIFENCESLIFADLSGLNTSNVTNMSNMFSNCVNLRGVDLSGVYTYNVTNMSGMFKNCYALTELDVSSFSTVSVTNFSRMFYLCENLKALDVSNFSIGSADLSYMFYSCESLVRIDIRTWNMSKVTNDYGMFFYCNAEIIR